MNMHLNFTQEYAAADSALHRMAAQPHHVHPTSSQTSWFFQFCCFFIIITIRLPPEFLLMIGLLTWWCASTLGAALPCGSRAGSNFGLLITYSNIPKYSDLGRPINCPSSSGSLIEDLHQAEPLPEVVVQSKERVKQITTEEIFNFCLCQVTYNLYFHSM